MAELHVQTPATAASARRRVIRPRYVSGSVTARPGLGDGVQRLGDGQIAVDRDDAEVED